MAKRRAARGRIKPIWIYTGLGVAALLLLNRKAAAATPAGPAGSAQILPPAPVPGSLAPTGPQVTAAAAIWQNLTAAGGPTTGHVNLPTGSQPAALFLPWATDGAGNTYTMWAGQIYIVNVDNPDLEGNYSSRLLGT